MNVVSNNWHLQVLITCDWPRSLHHQISSTICELLMNPLAMRLAIKSTPASGEIPRTITRLVTCLAWDMRYVCHAYCDIYPSSIPKFVCLKSFLHSPRRGAELSYHKPADHWWSWHFINILSLSIGNFLSIHRLNYGQTSSRSTYF